MSKEILILGKEAFDKLKPDVQRFIKQQSQQIADLEAKLAEKEKELKGKETLNQIFKDNREAKISFAVEQLSKTRNFVNGQEIFSKYKCESKVCRDILQAIDNQIKQLKEGK